MSGRMWHSMRARSYRIISTESWCSLNHSTSHSRRALPQSPACLRVRLGPLLVNSSPSAQNEFETSVSRTLGGIHDSMTASSGARSSWSGFGLTSSGIRGSGTRIDTIAKSRDQLFRQADTVPGFARDAIKSRTDVPVARLPRRRRRAIAVGVRRQKTTHRVVCTRCDQISYRRRAADGVVARLLSKSRQIQQISY